MTDDDDRQRLPIDPHLVYALAIAAAIVAAVVWLSG